MSIPAGGKDDDTTIVSVVVVLDTVQTQILIYVRELTPVNIRMHTLSL
jgi:hypothetical protein